MLSSRKRKQKKKKTISNEQRKACTVALNLQYVFHDILSYFVSKTRAVKENEKML